MKELILLGSTGSIGTRAVSVIRRNPDRFRVVGLAASGRNIPLLAEQAIDLRVEVVATSRADTELELSAALSAEMHRRGLSRTDVKLPRLITGPDAPAILAQWPAHSVLNAMVGSAGLPATLAALHAGRTLLLANKESLVAGGKLVMGSALPGQIVPIDSEHSALAHCLRGSAGTDVRRMVITASGGPFFGRSRSFLEGVTPDQALAHPTWRMGPVISINSATMVNKGLELIEAHLLFDIPFERLEVVIHPQSTVHAMVEYLDGSTLAQLGPPDQCSSIAAGLSWPDRLPDAAEVCDWTKAATWQFYPLRDEEFPVVSLAREVGSSGGTAPAIFNAANEECVAAFLHGRLPFPGIVELIHEAVSDLAHSSHHAAGSTMVLEDILEAEKAARQHTRGLIELWRPSRERRRVVC